MYQDLKQYLDQKLAAMDVKFATKQELEGVKTTLLTASEKGTTPAEARARTHAAVLRAMDLEMESLVRAQKLENRQ